MVRDDIREREKRVTAAVFAAYLLLLCWLVLFKFAVRVENIPRLRSLNLIPFHYDQENSVHLREVVLNILAFLPAGVYFSEIFGKRNKLFVPGAVALLSLTFEILQWLFAIGGSDITDLITNTAGGVCGMLLFWLMGKLFPKNRMRIINILGIFIEALGLLFITVLILVNH